MIKLHRKPHVSKFEIWYKDLIVSFRHKIISPLEDYWFFFKNFFRNVWIFRKALSCHVWWDYSGILYFLEIGILDMKGKMSSRSVQEQESVKKKIVKMERAAQILGRIRKSGYIHLAEQELGEIQIGNTWFETYAPNSEVEKEWLGSESELPLYEMKDDLSEEQKAHNSKIFSRSDELERKEWEELFQILRGQDNLENLETSEESDDPWGKAYDGSGLKSWWD